MNILSIDLDILFPCNNYSKQMRYDLDPLEAWDLIDNIKINHDINIKILDYLYELINKKASNSKVIIGEEHIELYDYMKDNKLYNNNLYNLDFHHDIGYKKSECINMENWVYFSKKENFINEYHWGHQEFFDNPKFKTIENYNDFNILDKNIDSYPEFDIIFFSISKHFTPKKYWFPVLNTLLSVCNQKLKYFQEVGVQTHVLDIWNKLYHSLPKSYNDFKGDRLFRYKEFYIYFDVSSHECSCINYGESINLFRIFEVIDFLFDEYKSLVTFCINDSRIEKAIENISRRRYKSFKTTVGNVSTKMSVSK